MFQALNLSLPMIIFNKLNGTASRCVRGFPMVNLVVMLPVSLLEDYIKYSATANCAKGYHIDVEFMNEAQIF